MEQARYSSTLEMFCAQANIRLGLPTSPTSDGQRTPTPRRVVLSTEVKQPHTSEQNSRHVHTFHTADAPTHQKRTCLISQVTNAHLKMSRMPSAVLRIPKMSCDFNSTGIPHILRILVPGANAELDKFHKAPHKAVMTGCG